MWNPGALYSLHVPIHMFLESDIEQVVDEH